MDVVYELPAGDGSAVSFSSWPQQIPWRWWGVGGGAAPCCCWTVVGVRLLTWLPLVGWGGGLGGEPHDC